MKRNRVGDSSNVILQTIDLRIERVHVDDDEEKQGKDGDEDDEVKQSIIFLSNNDFWR